MGRTLAAGGAFVNTVLLEHATDALLVVEHGEALLQVVNIAAERLLGFTREELLKLGPANVTDPDESPRLAEVRAHLAEHGWWHGTWGLRRKDGSIVQTEATVARVTVGGRVIVQGLFRECGAHQRWLQDALIRAHEVQHDLNNQLALTTGYAELLADNARLPPDMRDAAREALAGGLGAVEAGKRLISCFTQGFPDGLTKGFPEG